MVASLWISLLTSASVTAASHAQSPPTCTNASYGLLTYTVSGPFGARFCSKTLVTSTAGTTGNPTLPSPAGAWYTEVWSPSTIYNDGVTCAVSCSTAGWTTGGDSINFITSRTMTQSLGAAQNLTSLVWGYLTGASWNVGRTNVYSCSSSTLVTINVNVLYAGERRDYGFFTTSREYHELCSATTAHPTNEPRVDGNSWMSKFDSGPISYFSTYDPCTGLVSAPTSKCSAVACTIVGPTEV